MQPTKGKGNILIFVDIKATVYVQSARTCLLAQLRTDLFNESILFMQVQTVEGGNRQTDS